MNDDYFSMFGDRGQMALAGALGGIVRWLTLRSGLRDGFVAIVVGAICAVYLGPVCLPLLDPMLGKLVTDQVARVGLSGFVIGVGGIGVSGFILELWQYRRDRAKAASGLPPSDEQ